MWCEGYEYNYWLQTELFRFLCSAVAVRPSVRPSARPTNNNTTQRKVRDPLSKKSNTNTVGCWRIQWKFSVSNRFLLLFVRFIVKVVLLIRSTNYPFYCVYSSPSDLYYEKWVSLRQQWQAVVNIAHIGILQAIAAVKTSSQQLRKNGITTVDDMKSCGEEISTITQVIVE